jgi:hypothetical protein
MRDLHILKNRCISNNLLPEYLEKSIDFRQLPDPVDIIPVKIEEYY